MGSSLTFIFYYRGHLSLFPVIIKRKSDVCGQKTRTTSKLSNSEYCQNDPFTRLTFILKILFVLPAFSSSHRVTEKKYTDGPTKVIRVVLSTADDIFSNEVQL